MLEWTLLCDQSDALKMDLGWTRWTQTRLNTHTAMAWDLQNSLAHQGTAKPDRKQAVDASQNQSHTIIVCNFDMFYGFLGIGWDEKWQKKREYRKDLASVCFCDAS